MWLSVDDEARDELDATGCLNENWTTHEETRIDDRRTIEFIQSKYKKKDP